MIILAPKKQNGFNYRRKFVPNTKFNRAEIAASQKNKKEYYTEDWDLIRKKVYTRDGYRCVLCGKKGKLHAHHIIPVKISHDNSMSNLISVCEKCHRKFEAMGFSILQHGGSRDDVKRAELKIIMEARKARLEKYMSNREKTLENEKDRPNTEGINEDNARC